MATPEALKTYVISYETNQATWKLYLLAYSKEDAMEFLMEEVGNEAEGFRINNFESREEIHAITPKAKRIIAGPEKIVEVEKLICPWCESTDYENFHAMKMHIVKTHTGKSQLPKKPKK
jgi:hypothetical protein